jgi:hypothetical protein
LLDFGEARSKRNCPAGEVFHILNRAVARLTSFETPDNYPAFKNGGTTHLYQG